MGWTLRSPRPTAPDSPRAAESPSGQKNVTRARGLVLRSFKEGQQRYMLEAESQTGKEGAETRFGGVKVTFDCVQRGKRETCVITADDCLFDPAIPRGIFQGHVVLTTSDGFEFRSKSLVYRGDKQLAKTDDDAEFRRKAISGSGTGMVYSADAGRIEILAHAYLRIDGETEPPTEIHSRSAVLDRSDGTLRFEDDARVTQGEDRLESTRLILTFNPETHVLYRAVAAGGVDLRMSGARPLPGGIEASGARGGPRHLICRRLDIAFREDRSMEQVVAQTDVDLTILPGPGQYPEKRHVLARQYLIMDCDEKGRASALRAGGKVRLRGEPSSNEIGATPREVRCDRFESTLDPETGQAASADFFGAVTFARAKQRAHGNVARYEGGRSRLALGDHPALEDDTGTLEAKDITLGSESGDVTAEGEVRHVLRGQSRPEAGPFGGGGKPTLVACRAFSSIQKTRTATYTGDAILRSDRSEIRADSIVVVQDAGGRRTLHASKDVVSLLNQAPDPDKPAATPPAPIECRADVMDYDEARRSIVYTGNATVRQGAIVTRSPKATLTLTQDLRSLEKLVAGDPVEITQGDMRATGREGTYTTADQTVVLVGNDAVLKDSKQETKGRSITFRVGGDRVIVDGQEEARTESSFQQQIGGRKP